jgi:hypothetical protein
VGVAITSIRLLVASLVVGPKKSQPAPLLKIATRIMAAQIRQDRAADAASEEATSSPDPDRSLSNAAISGAVSHTADFRCWAFGPHCWSCIALTRSSEIPAGREFRTGDIDSH